MKNSEISKKWLLILMTIGLLLFVLTVYGKEITVVVARIISMLLIVIPILNYMINEGDE